VIRVRRGGACGLTLLCALGLAAALSTCARQSRERIPAPEASGRRLSEVLDRMGVEHRWRPGEPVDWRTGEPDPGAIPLSGHCSAFVAAVCARFGVYILCPPEHSERLLANAQCDWLRDEGHERGWRPIADGATAQVAANRGELVVACWKNPEEDDAGHIAVVRPAAKDASRLAREGPDIVQAGAHNYARTSVRHGFRLHPSAWRRGEIRYYAHPAR
jgi:hypothetical protein